MKVLIVKMSSLGDVLHTLPALTDAGKAIPGIQFDWVVEEGFSQLPRWHPLVNKIIPIAFRRLRKTPLASLRSQEWKTFWKTLRAEKYDKIIDAQGLIKSALITRLARGERVGPDRQSAWESLAHLAYQKKCQIDPAQHAVTRVRQLFAQALGYSMPQTSADYGIDRQAFKKPENLPAHYTIFLHGTTWDTKLWPENYWQRLAQLIGSEKRKVLLPWGNVEEKARAEKIAEHAEHAEVLPKMKLNEVTGVLAHADAIVAVDTGLGHVAAALAVPTISLYGPTDPKKTGTVGDNQTHLSAQFSCAPCLQRECTYQKPSEEKPACFTTLPPELVLEHLKRILL